MTANGFSTCVGALHAVRTILLEDIVTGVGPSDACVFEDPPVENWKSTRSTNTTDMSTVGLSPRSTTQALTGTGTSAPPIRIRSQEIGSPRGSIGPQKVRNAHLFQTSITQFFS